MNEVSSIWLANRDSTNSYHGGKDLILFLNKLLEEILALNSRSVLFVPPDFTRVSSEIGYITSYLYHSLPVDIKKAVLPALGLHHAMSEEQKQIMFGNGWGDMDFIEHTASGSNQKYPNKELGKIYSNELLAWLEFKDEHGDKVEGPLSKAWKNIESITVAVNQAVFDFEVVISLGQVVPHEVLGYANYHKNILIGLGGEDFISKSHFISAAIGVESLLARATNPMRNLLTNVYKKYLAPHTNIFFLFTIIKSSTSISDSAENRQSNNPNMSVNPEQDIESIQAIGTVKHLLPKLPKFPKSLAGIFWGKGEENFFAACALSEEENITILPKLMDEVFVYMPQEKYQSLWLANKAIYRTLGILKPGGILYIDAPGLRAYGENPEMHKLIAKYGYMDITRLNVVLQQEILLGNSEKKRDKNLVSNLAVAGHLVHGYQKNHRVIFVDYGNKEVDYLVNKKNTKTTAPLLTCQDYERVGFQGIGYQKYMTKLSSLFPNAGSLSGSIIQSVQNQSVEHGQKSYYFIYDAGLGFWKNKLNSPE